MLIDLSPLAALSLLIALSVVLNRVVEYVFSTPFDKIEKLKPYKWTLLYISLILGVIASVSYNLDLLSIEVFGLPPSLFGRVLTGIIVSGGSNLINDVWPKPQGRVTASASVSSNGETARASLSTPSEGDNA